MNIAFVSSEVYPFSKTGGLADVAGSLPIELKKKGLNLIIITPLYRSINREKFNIKPSNIKFKILINYNWEEVSVFETELDGVKVFFVYNETYFNLDNFYEETNSGLRFGLLCYSAIECVKCIKFTPDIFHLNDWQTALIPVLLKTNYLNDIFFQHTKTVITIHNLAYQGYFPESILGKLGLPKNIYHYDGIEFYNQVNFLKGGIVFSDYITTVSPSYAEEILTYEAGRGLDGILNRKKDKLSGILNGIDTNSWNPSKDKSIFQNFDKNNIQNKLINKINLQKILNITIDKEIPIFAYIGRLTEQKGIDLIYKIIDKLMLLKVQIVILGDGKIYLNNKYNDKLSINTEFNEELARKIYAGSDFFLMPSLFEPCGISQMIAMRYGTVPIVREVGGLKDTVKNKVTGFTFKEYNDTSLLDAVLDGLKMYNVEKLLFKKIIKKCMEQDFSWKRSCIEYIKVYEKVIQASE